MYIFVTNTKKLTSLSCLQWSNVPACCGGDGVEPGPAEVNFIWQPRNQEPALQIASEHPKLVRPATSLCSQLQSNISVSSPFLNPYYITRWNLPLTWFCCFFSPTGEVLEFATASVNLARLRLNWPMTWKTCRRGRTSSTHTGRRSAAARTVRETLHRISEYQSNVSTSWGFYLIYE